MKTLPPLRSVVVGLGEANRRWPWLLLLVWVAVYGRRPFELGFYHDDWWQYVEPVRTTAFSTERWSAFIGWNTAYAPRPVFGAFSFLFASISLDSPGVAQALAALMALACAWSLRSWLAGLGAAGGPGSVLAADLAAVFWLTAPWSTGTTVFLGAAFGMLPAQFFLTEAARLSLGAVIGPRRTAVIALLLVASALSYETFYFCAFPVFLAQWWSGRARFPSRRAAIFFWLALAGAQGAAIGFNRAIAARNGGASKMFSVHWIDSWLHNLGSLPGTLAGTMEAHDLWWAAGAAVVLGGTLFHLRRNRTELLAGRALIPAASMGAAGLVCVMVVAAIYALVGYEFTAAGVMGRTLGGVTWAVSLAIFGVVGCIGAGAPTLARRVALAGCGWTVVVQTAALHQHQTEWAGSWAAQREVIARAPLAKIGRLPPGSAVLFIGPDRFGVVEIFAAPWDLTAAVWSREPLNRDRRPFQIPVTFYPATRFYDWRFRAGQLHQELPGFFKQSFAVQRLFVWDYAAATLVEVADGYTRLH